jgi:hypothetical protein
MEVIALCTTVRMTAFVSFAAADPEYTLLPTLTMSPARKFTVLCSYTLHCSPTCFDSQNSLTWFYSYAYAYSLRCGLPPYSHVPKHSHLFPRFCPPSRSRLLVHSHCFSSFAIEYMTTQEAIEVGTPVFRTQAVPRHVMWYESVHPETFLYIAWQILGSCCS